MAVIVVLAAAVDARADAGIAHGKRPAPANLQLSTPPVRLRMRTLPPRRSEPRPRAAQAKTPVRRPSDGGGLRVSAVRPKSDPDRPRGDVHVRLDLGYTVDGAGVSKRRTLAGGLLSESGFRAVRGTGFGELFFGTNGVVLPSVDTYLAAKARFATAVPVPPLATPYDRASDLHVRSAWAESADFSSRPWLKPLRIRAGRQFVYGAAIAHLDGVTVAWERRGIAIRGFLGARVPDWALDDRIAPVRGSMDGLDLRVDLNARNIPVVASLASLSYEDHRHIELGLAYARKDKDLVLRGSARLLDGEWARERLTARLQVSDVTQVTVDVDYRDRNDWRWDPEWVRTSDEDVVTRFLDLGTVTPRLTSSVRAGTVLLDNIDLLVRGAGAMDMSERLQDRPSPFSRGWLELGSALEVRLRRALAVGLSARGRAYDRPTVTPIVDIEAAEGELKGQPFPSDPTAFGETTFLEAGLSMRYSAGARRFSASAEVFARQTRMVPLYVDDDPTDEELPGDVINDPSRDSRDQRGCGRFSIEAWPSPRLRLRAEYELSTLIEVAPEIHGYKNLRVLAEGQF